MPLALVDVFVPMVACVRGCLRWLVRTRHALLHCTACPCGCSDHPASISYSCVPRAHRRVPAVTRTPAHIRPALQIRRAVLAGARPELPPLDALPGAGAASMPGLEAYCSLMRACWAGDPQQRPTLEPVVAQLSALLEAVAP